MEVRTLMSGDHASVSYPTIVTGNTVHLVDEPRQKTPESSSSSSSGEEHGNTCEGMCELRKPISFDRWKRVLTKVDLVTLSMPHTQGRISDYTANETHPRSLTRYHIVRKYETPGKRPASLHRVEVRYFFAPVSETRYIRDTEENSGN